jgi:hypothetical protein
MDLNEFTAEDWYNAFEGIGAVTGLIMVSDMSGPVGLMKEASAAAEVLRAGKWQTPFIAALRAELLAPTKERQEELEQIARARQEALNDQRADSAQVRQMGLDTIRKALAFVKEKAGLEAATEYRQMLGEIAQKTAEAANEGGFLGIGSKQISEGEQAALDEIEAALAR